MARAQRRSPDGRYARGPARAPIQRSEDILSALRTRQAQEKDPAAPYTWAAVEVARMEAAMRRTFNPFALAVRRIERRHLENRYGAIDWKA